MINTNKLFLGECFSLTSEMLPPPPSPPTAKHPSPDWASTPSRAPGSPGSVAAAPTAPAAKDPQNFGQNRDFTILHQ